MQMQQAMQQLQGSGLIPDVGGMGSLGGIGGFGGLGGGFGSPANNASSEPPEVRFASQLQQLRDMGFDGPQALRALEATGGNVNAAVDRLLSGFM